jgi:hypothetical protein
MILSCFPFTEEKIRVLKIGDEVSLSGVVVGGREPVYTALSPRSSVRMR